MMTEKPKTVACPICWNPKCHVFRISDTRKIEGAIPVRENTGDPVRSHWLRRWHVDGVDICDVCKRSRESCRRAVLRHADRVADLTREVNDAKKYVVDELLEAFKKATGEEKKQLKIKGDRAEIEWSRKNRRLLKLKDKRPCRPPERKIAPSWWTLEEPDPALANVTATPTRTSKNKNPKAAPAKRQNTSPIMAQYRDAKAQHPDMILLFRMGDFYEMFDGDARAGAKVLGLTITSREDFDMAGFPHHSLERNLHTLLASGLRVAICDQVDSADGKSVKRVVREGKIDDAAKPTLGPVESVTVASPTAIPAAAYCDGGVISSNPSRIGGTYAAVFVSKSGEQISSVSGTVTPAQAGLPAITNNYTELLAAVVAMELLPANWTGTLYTDSNVTRLRIVNAKPSMAGIPTDLQERLAHAKSRIGGAWSPGQDRNGATGGMCVVLLKGHPTKADLAAGEGARGEGKQSLPVSKWNVLCDKLCGEEAAKVIAGGVS